jgi:L-rhamnose-H+ transport protein
VHGLPFGFTLIFLSAACSGAFAVPLRMRRRFEWENTWLLAFFCAMLAFPLITAAFVVPVWPAAVSAVSIGRIATVVAFGFMWGSGAVTFAIGINALGLSLGYAVIMGVITVVGSTIPMIRRWSQIPDNARIVILIGIAVCIVGVAVCGRAGMMREQAAAGVSMDSRAASKAVQVTGRAAFIALLWCVFSGILSAGNNLGYDFADRVQEEAVRLGTDPIKASLARWIVEYWGGFLAVLVFCGYKMLRTGSWKKYGGPGSARDGSLAVFMGLLHFVSQMAYGVGAYYVGRLGTTIGYAVMVAGSLILANLFGFVMGEWRSTPRPAVRTIYLGLALLVGAVLILAYGNGLVQSTS